MRVTNTDSLTILEADEGKLLFSQSTNQYYKKVYLGKNDSPDNYREVIDEEYQDTTDLEKITKEQDDVLLDVAYRITILEIVAGIVIDNKIL